MIHVVIITKIKKETIDNKIIHEIFKEKELSRKRSRKSEGR